jgi:beta-phosphoglucomutase
MSKLRGVVFDLDGVLVSTDVYHYRAWKRLADELGMAFSEEQNHLLRGVSREESLKIIYRLNNRPLPPAAEFKAQTSRKNAYYVDMVAGMTPAEVLPGGKELLLNLRAAGILCAIASSSKNTALVLARSGLAALADAVADGNDIARSKPDPQVFLVAARKLGVPPAECIGVEDAAAGIEAIKAAGMVAVGIGDAATGGAVTVPSVRDLSTKNLVELMRAC